MSSSAGHALFIIRTKERKKEKKEKKQEKDKSAKQSQQKHTIHSCAAGPYDSEQPLISPVFRGGISSQTF